MNIKDFTHQSIGKPKTINNFWKKILKNPFLGFSVIIIFTMFSAALFGHFLAPHDPIKTDLSLRLASPGLEYPLGNDSLGRCLFSRILCGARASIGLSFAAVAISSVFGIIIGLVSGFLGGLVDEFLMRIVDIFLSFPEIIAAMAIAGILGHGAFNLVFAITVVSWMRYARLVRGITLSIKEQDYVKSAMISGVSKTAIIFRHIFPANIPSIIVLITIGLGKAILGISALGFLGFGVQPPYPEWGTLLMEGKDYILSASHLSLYPGIAIMLTVLSLNLLGDSLRDMWE